jgi:hypothetical protein
LEEIGTGIAGGMDNVVEILSAFQRLTDVVSDKMETGLLPIVGKALLCTLTVPSHRIDVTETVSHQ